MAAHVLNLFEVTNLSQLNCSYRLLKVEGLTADPEGGDLEEKNLNILVKKLAFEGKMPVALVRSGGIACVAIPWEQPLPSLEHTLTPDVVTLIPEDKECSLDFGNLTRETERIALSFLSFTLRTPLMDDHRLWNASPLTFLVKRPVNWRDDTRETDVFGGFGVRLLRMDRKIYLAVRLAYKYVDRKWLTDRCDASQLHEYHMRHALYHFGHRWFPVQLLGPTGKSIAEQKFQPADNGPVTTVYDYTVAKASKGAPPWIMALDKDSPAINYRYPGNKKRRYGAAALCKLIHATDHPSTKSLHRMAIKPPQQRYSQTGQIVAQYFGKAELNGVPVQISIESLRTRPKLFRVPDQIFGQEEILRIRDGSRPDGIDLDDLGQRRLSNLLDNRIGGLVTSGFDAQYLIAPEGLPRGIVEDFQDRVQKTVQQFVHTPYSMELLLYKDQGCNTLKEQVEAILAACSEAAIKQGYAVLILPRSPKPDLHNYIKRRLLDTLPCQCVLGDNLQAFYGTHPQNGQARYKVKPDLAGRYTSYLRYAALGHLIVNRKWLWALANDLHYDVYIGMDVLHHTAAFVFLYESGRRCYVHVRSSKQKEKLSARQIREVLYTRLREDLKGSHRPPRSIVIHRDGRGYHQEWQGFKEAVRRLQAEGILAQDVQIGIVEVLKHSSLGLRLAFERDGRLGNPRIGSWHAWNNGEGIVCTTGTPFRNQGTANPLHIRVAYGDLDISKVLEDVFALSQLCWMVPDNCIRLPITIKLADDFLRPVAADADEDEAVYGEDHDEEEPETDTTSTRGDIS